MFTEAFAQAWRAIARGFRGAYDYAGTTMIVSTVWFFFGMFPSLLALLVFVQVPAINSLGILGIVCIVLLGPLTAGVYSICDAIVRGEEVHYKEYFGHLRRHYKKAAGITAVMGTILAILVLDVLFFWQIGTGFTRIIAVFWLYVILVWMMCAQYVFAILARRNRSVWETLKMAALVALDNPVATLAVGAVAALTAVASYLLRVPLMLFLAGTLGFLHCAALDELLKKYQKARSEGEAAGDRAAADLAAKESK